VLVYDPYLTPEHVSRFGGTKCELHDMLAASDFVSIHCPLTSETRGMIGAREFAAMRAGAFFIATARGEIYDERAIEHALESGHLAGAGLDVWQEEPPALDHPLLRRDNVVASPHIAGVTRRAYRSVAEGAALQWIEIFQGKRPPRLVNKKVWPRYAERYHRIFAEPVADSAP
jgi:D-3-phosphoglycerate dehydrogenase